MTKNEYLQYLTAPNLNLLGIRELRRLAFAVGVYGFTLYNKQDLIMHTIDVLYGREAPKTQTSKGRPTSITKDRTDILNQIVGKLKLLKSLELETLSQPFVASSSAQYETDFATTISVSGYYEEYEGNGYIRANETYAWTTQCVVPKEISTKHKLRKADKVVGIAKLDKSGNYILSEIISAPQTHRKSFDLLQISKPIEQLKISGQVFENINKAAPITKGGRASINGSSQSISNWKHEFLHSIACKNIVVVGSYVAPEELEDLNTKYENVFATSFGQDENVQKRNISLGFERAKRLAEENKESVVVVWSLASTIKSFDLGVVLSLSNPAAKTDVSSFRQLCSSAHNTKEGNSITLICFAESDNAVQNAIIEQVSEIFTTKIICKDEPNSEKFPIDVKNSYSLM